MPDSPEPGSSPRTFLIVDDNAAFRETLRAFLPPGRVCECSDGGGVMAAYLAEKPDWVFMDVEMPVVDGLTATRELTRRFPSSRVVIVTHHREDDLRAAAFEQGACGFVLKDDLQQIRALLVDDDPGRQRIP